MFKLKLIFDKKLRMTNVIQADECRHSRKLQPDLGTSFLDLYFFGALYRKPLAYVYVL